MTSIRKRALLSGAIIALVTVLTASIVLFAYIDQVTLARFDRSLYDRHVQLSVALSNSASDPSELERTLTDPAYGRTYSGSYWQVTAPNGTVYTSPSLFGTLLDPPRAAGPKLSAWTAPGPDGTEMRGMQQVITLADGSRWVVAVAQSLHDLRNERLQTRRSLLLAFGFIALFGLVGAFAQTAAMLRPLRRLQAEVAHRWDRGEGPDPADYPNEVAPLVSDINTLISRNHDIVARARRQSADLAHALKTPSAILRNELTLLADQGADVSRAEAALARIDSQLGRSLARMRAGNSLQEVAPPTDLSASIDRFGRLFAKLAEQRGKTLEIATAPGLGVRMDSQDIEEILGNLLDNALKWCRSTIRLSATAGPAATEIRIEDDGPGIPPEVRAEVLAEGRRLDTSKPGAGLGLAIASDIATAYGATLDLGVSERLGGLAVRVSIPPRIGLDSPGPTRPDNG